MLDSITLVATAGVVDQASGSSGRQGNSGEYKHNDWWKGMTGGGGGGGGGIANTAAAIGTGGGGGGAGGGGSSGAVCHYSSTQSSAFVPSNGGGGGGGGGYGGAPSVIADYSFSGKLVDQHIICLYLSYTTNLANSVIPVM